MRGVVEGQSPFGDVHGGSGAANLIGKPKHFSTSAALRIKEKLVDVLSLSGADVGGNKVFREEAPALPTVASAYVAVA
jgi:hypothetical protein